MSKRFPKVIYGVLEERGAGGAELATSADPAELVRKTESRVAARYVLGDIVEISAPIVVKVRPLPKTRPTRKRGKR